MVVKSTNDPHVSKSLLYDDDDDALEENPGNPSNPIWFSKRLLVAIVIFLCFTNSTMLLSNMNIAVVEMTSNKTIVVGNTTVVRPPEFQWDTITIGTICSIVSYGGLFAIFGGYFVDKFGGSVSCAISTMVSGALIILHPATLYLNYYLFLVCRLVTGFFLSFIYVCTSEMYSRWYPKNERSTLIAIGSSGVSVGGAISYPLFGYIADEWGWQMVFYVSGIISSLLSLLCLAIVRNRPSQDSWITKEELSHILVGTDDASRKEEPHPYTKIFLSAPVLAVCVGKFVLCWVTAVLGGSLPLYVKDLTGKSTDEIGIISSIPIFAEIFTLPVTGAFLDGWKNTTDIKLTRMHKITITFAFLTSSISLTTATLFSNFTSSMIFFVLIHIMMAIVPPVLQSIIVNISPNDSSVIAGLSQFFSGLGVIISRTIIGFMTINHSLPEWNNCFLLTAGVLIFGTIIFIKFASSEAQPWSSSWTDGQERSRLIRIKYRRKSSTKS